MKKIWCLFVSLSLAFLLGGCGSWLALRSDEMIPTQPGKVTVAELAEGVWTNAPARYRLRLSAVLTYGWSDLPFEALAEIDTGTKSVKLAGLTATGMTLFKIEATALEEGGGADAGSGNFVVEGLGRIPHFERLMGEGFLRIFLSPSPGANDTLEVEALRYILLRGHQSEGGDTGALKSTFTGDGRLLGKQLSGGGSSWRVRYGDYREVEAVSFPFEIQYWDDRGGLDLVLRVSSVTLLINGKDGK